MTLDPERVARETRRLIEEARRANEDPLLSLRQVSVLTKTPMSTLKRWVYKHRAIPIEYEGRCLSRPHPRIRASVVREMFEPF